MRWPQFSLRTLLLGFCLSGVALYWCCAQYTRANHQRHVVAQLAALGATVTYNWQTEDAVGITAGPPTWLPDFVRDALGHDYFQNVRAVDLYQSYDVGTQDSEICSFEKLCAALQSLPQMEALGFDYCELDAKGYAEFAKLKQLKELKLGYVHPVNVGLSSIGQMQNLRSLEVGIDFRNEPKGFSQLAALDLETLSLSQAWKDIKGQYHFRNCAPCELSALAKMPRLKNLKLYGMRLNQADYALLLQLPQLEVLEFRLVDHQDLDFQTLATSGKLKQLRFMDCLVTDNNLRELCQIPALMELELHNLDRDPPPLTRECVLECAKQCPNLVLIVNYNRVTPEGTFVRVKR